MVDEKWSFNCETYKGHPQLFKEQSFQKKTIGLHDSCFKLCGVGYIIEYNLNINNFMKNFQKTKPF